MARSNSAGVNAHHSRVYWRQDHSGVPPDSSARVWRGSEHANRRDVRHTVPSVAPYCALHMASCAYQVLDIVKDLDRHEEAKELVFLLTTDAKDDPELQAQVAQVCRPCCEVQL